MPNNTIREQLKAYPNPTNEGIVFFNKTISGTIIDLSGNRVDAIFNSNYWKYDGLSNGLYIINSERFGTVKVIIQ